MHDDSLTIPYDFHDFWKGSTQGENMRTVKNEKFMYNSHEFKTINRRLPFGPCGGNV